MSSNLQKISEFYLTDEFKRSRPIFKWFLWATFFSFFCSTPFVGTFWRVFLLRLFGAKIGKNVRLYPNLKIKFPWKFSLGDNSMIGSSTWIDNVDFVEIKENVCISQGAFICSGNHNYKSLHFEYKPGKIIINSHSWIAAKSIVAPGTIIGEGVVLAIGSVAKGYLLPYKIYQGNPAKPIRNRINNSQ